MFVRVTLNKKWEAGPPHAGGGKGAAIGAIPGGAGGFLSERYTKGPEAEVKSGTDVGIYLKQSISMPRFTETRPANP